MGEAAYLTRSCSQPPPRDRRNEVIPRRCLNQSISFGRYETEQLSWEKWSAFSRNRYLEEVEMYSKPGSVAKMKAYFEAHYKGLAAKKRALEDEEASKCSEEEAMSPTDQTSFTDSQMPQSDVSSFDIPYQGRSPDVQLAILGLATRAINHTAPAMGQYHFPEATEPKEMFPTDQTSFTDSQMPQSDVSSFDIPYQGRSPDVQVAILGLATRSINHTVPDMGQYHFPDATEHKETRILSLGNSSEAEVEQPNYLDLVDNVRGEEAYDCTLEGAIFKPESSGWFEVQPSTDIEHKNDENTILKIKLPKVSSEADGHAKPDSKVKEKLTGSNSKKTEPRSNSTKLSASFSRAAAPACSSSKEGARTSNKRATTTRDNTVDTKRLASESTHMAISVSVEIKNKSSSVTKKTGVQTVSSGDEIKNKSSSVTNRTGIQNNVTPLVKLSIDNITPQPPKRASVHGVSRQKCPSPQPETEKNKATASSSLAGSRSIGQAMQSPSVENSKDSDSHGHKARSHTIVCPFKFRCEERAVKRREFFERLKEKESEKLGQQEKTKRRENNSRRMLDGVGFKPNPVADNSSSSTIKKIAPTRSHSPRHVRRQSSMLQEESRAPSPRRSSVKTDKSHVKPEKNYLRPTQSTVLHSKNTRRENASPSIL